jgi:membrane-associated phospholipid phosphatase
MNKQIYFWQILRAMPVLTYFYGIINFMIDPGYNTIFFLVVLTYDKICNASLKTISEYIYDIIGKDEICLLGRGKRPQDAKNTSCFLKYPEQFSTSYGMPSGHSQTAWLFSVYLIMHILYNNYYFNGYANHQINNILKIINITIIICIASMVSISRVIENCHTLQQVIIGGLIGCIIGYYTYFIKMWIYTSY